MNAFSGKAGDGVNPVKLRAGRGFSLVEMVIVTAIVAVLAGGVVTIAAHRADTSSQEQFMRDRVVLLQALDLYVRLYDRMPETIDALWRDKVLLGENRSPWGTPYSLESGEHGVEFSTVDRGGHTIDAGALPLP